MTEPSRAVFLSYASEDAEATRRICEALRAAGIEVWFDQSELRGGDVWDRQIKKQVHDCALFIAVISANTQARLEGYFRREWRLAVERSHDMADSRPFLVPIVIDATNEQDAEVPESFRAVQWTRLRGGETPPAFCERIMALLTGGQASGRASVTPVPSYHVPPRVRRVRWVVIAVVGALVVLVGGWQARRLMTPKSVATPVAGISSTASANVPEKSIAVLPFVDMSEKKDQEYFSDGLSEELIDRLAHSPDLKVIARTSSFAFKGKNEDMRTIAAKLGVANLLEGSVRKAGTDLRITAQLIRASDGVHLWSESYERKLTDIFKVQEEISDTVAKALKAALMVNSRTKGSQASNIEAYNLLLRGKYFYTRGNKGDNDRAIESYKQALALDPNYALAWARLARVYSWQGQIGERPVADTKMKGRGALTRALAIDPGSALAHRTLGDMFLYFDWNWAAAKIEYERAIALDPDGRDGRDAAEDLLELQAARTGEFNELIRLRVQDVERNPLDGDSLFFLAHGYFAAGRYSESAATWRKSLDLNSAYAGGPAGYGLALLMMGKPVEALAAAASEPDDASKLWALACIYWTLGRRSDSDDALRKFETQFAGTQAYAIAQVHAYRRDVDGAFRWLDRAHAQRDPNLVNVTGDPLLRNVQGDPHYKTLLRTMHLPE